MIKCKKKFGNPSKGIMVGMKCLTIDENKNNNNIDKLRYTTNRFNCSRSRRGGASEYVGVFFNKQFVHKVWCATIQINGVSEYLGAYHTELEASNAYQKTLKERCHV